MNPQYIYDTIAAISTPTGKGAIAIIRISGEKSLDTAQKIFHSSKNNLLITQPRTLHYGKIIHPTTKHHIDEVLMVYMPPQSSFTKEHLIEIHSHGGNIVPYTILKLLLEQGIRLAEPGEFTKRAYLNGRIDLTQAEAIHDIINARCDQSLNLALSNLEKRFSNLLKSFRDQIIHILALLEVNIDYPEEDLEPVYIENSIRDVTSIIQKIDHILWDSKNGRVIREGIRVAIIGKTNVGKSSLFNYLIKEDRAIVSHIHGTTRDYLENHIVIQGVPVELIDTAGFRHTSDEIEEIGKSLSKKKMENAEYILWILDQSRPWDEDDQYILSQIDRNKTILIINKSDLHDELNSHSIDDKITPQGIFLISIKENKGLIELEHGLKDLFVNKDFKINDQTILCNIRQENLLNRTKLSLERSLNDFLNNVSYELIAIELRESLDTLGEIIGETTTEDILSHIFQHFCIGK